MNSRTKLGIAVIIFLFFLVGLSRILGKTSQVYQFNFSKTFEFKFKSLDLGAVIKKEVEPLEKDGSNYAVYVENLVTGEKYGLSESTIFPAASLYKLILMAAVLKEVELGSIKTDDIIFNNKSHLSNVLGGEDFGYEDTPEEIGYTVDEALTRVASISDNYAAIMLTEKLAQIRLSKDSGQGVESEKLLIKMASDLGMKDTDFTSEDGPVTTADDIAAFFRQLYNGQVVSKTTSEKIIELLSNSRLNDRIPAKLPEDIKVAHKTGELSHVRHDAGIVYLDGSPYIIVLMSKDLVYEDDAVKGLAQISKAVFDYFNSKKET